LKELRPPGVYVERERLPDRSISVVRTGVPGFLGVSIKGQLDEPILVQSFEHFRREFGDRVPGGYLYDAVKGFFDNGGGGCYVVRVARTERRRGIESASTAGAVIKDREGKDTIAITALNEGAWGNDVEIRVEAPEEPRVQTFLLQDLTPGDSEAVVKSTRGFLRGTVTRVHDGEKEEHLTVVEVAGKRIRFDRKVSGHFQSAAPTYLDPVEFTVVARLRQGAETFEGLSFSPASAKFFERHVNQASRWINLTNLDTETAIPACYPADLDWTPLVGGADGLSSLGPDDFIGYNKGPVERKGLGAFEVIDEVDLICAPDLFFALETSDRFRTARDVEAVQDAIITHCELAKDRFAILDLLPDAGFEEAEQWRLLFDSSYAAFYYPWLVVEHRGKRRNVPPCGHVAGVYAKCDENVGVHQPPANVEMEGVLDLAVLLNDEHLAILNRDGINCIRAIPNRGLRIWGARTICSDPQWRYVNVRRLFTMLVRSIRRGTQWTVFEPNDHRLWDMVSLNLRVFLESLAAKGYFKGETLEDAFYVKCDGETNPAEVRDAGQMIVEIGVAPVRPAEFITARIRQHLEDAAASAGEE
jgi:hypothetical protein